MPDIDRFRERLEDKSRSMTWVLTGDSITLGAKHLRGSRSYPELFSERVRYELRRQRDIFVNSGVDGEQLTGLLSDFDWRVRRFNPDIVSLMIGMNDCKNGIEGRARFEQQLRHFIQLSRSLGAIMVLHTTNPIDSKQITNRDDLSAYNRIVVEVAVSEKVILVDHWTHWQSHCTNLSLLHLWLDDPIHPNARGHLEMAVQLMKSVGVHDPRSAIIQVEKP
jgi:acyl-CoA thioesterase-1